ncbi:MAG: tetratricopeptide repeat protein [Deltaproteobacteria bacterium]|nr:tetratricopeptide repeat protein [Deltaproteobacteria bacterium]
MRTLLPIGLALTLLGPGALANPADPTPAEAVHDGDGAYRAQRFGEAAAAYGRELATQPRDVTLWYALGATRAVMRDGSRALEAWREALALAPARELLYRHAALVQMMMARAGQLRLEASPVDDPVARARAVLRQGGAAEALALLAGRDDYESSLWRGEAALAMGLSDVARRAFEGALRDRPGDRDALGGLAEALIRGGDLEAAREPMSVWLGERALEPDAFMLERAGEVAGRL